MESNHNYMRTRLWRFQMELRSLDSSKFETRLTSAGGTKLKPISCFGILLLFGCFELDTFYHRYLMGINEFADQTLKSIDHYIIDHRDLFLLFLCYFYSDRSPIN